LIDYYEVGVSTERPGDGLGIEIGVFRDVYSALELEEEVTDELAIAHRDEAEEANVEDLLNLLRRLARLHKEGTTDHDPNNIKPDITEDM